MYSNYDKTQTWGSFLFWIDVIAGYFLIVSVWDFNKRMMKKDALVFFLLFFFFLMEYF